MSTYFQTIKVSLLIFPLLAFFSLIPFVFYHYKKYGYVNGLRAIALYLFAFYCIAAWFMTLLPLPIITENFCELRAANTTPRLIPFQFVSEMVKELKGNISLVSVLKSKNFMVTAFNVLLLLPLGFFLRYLFKLNIYQATGIGFLVSLFFEITQVTGIYGIYPCPYRLFEVDDLMTNTIGVLLGSIMAGYITFLPDTTVTSLSNPKEVNRTQLFLAFAIDVFIVSLFIKEAEGGSYIVHFIKSVLIILAYFIALPRTKFGNTVGKKLVGLKLVNLQGQEPSVPQLMIRYGILLLIPILLEDITGFLIHRIEDNGIYALVYFILMGLWAIAIFGIAFFRKDYFGLHDIISGTKHINRNKIAV